MRVAVIGSRGLCIDIAPYIPADTTEIVTGGMPGIGALAEHYADQHDLPKLIVDVNHLHIGKAERKWRGTLIVDAADYVVAIWDGRSEGTQRAISYARRIGKPIEVYIVGKMVKKA